ncbi:unnamed protein product [Ranitomeya imitator]|uniref:Uncharacterized protein n=1 Tax=Ranitomeya imitator TaxID=111125 RepID=A0ABN9MBI4_9NEOB|nr:unnamed protein product [Ranitomeya imitator]
MQRTPAVRLSPAGMRSGITAAITAAPELITSAGVPDFDPASDLHVGDPDTTAHAADDAAPADSALPTLRGAVTTGKGAMSWDLEDTLTDTLQSPGSLMMMDTTLMTPITIFISMMSNRSRASEEETRSL